MAATSTVITVGAKPTLFYPLPTPWSVNSDCASHVYRQTSDRKILAWDPWYTNVDSAASTCYPEAVMSWWFQTPSQQTSIALGPTLKCPQLYTTATEKPEGLDVKHVYCCPSYVTVSLTTA